MAKLADLCRNMPVAVKSAQIWGMIGQTYDVERLARHDCRVVRGEYRRHEQPERIFAECKGQAVRKKCRSHVDRCGQGEYTGEKRFVGSYIHVACRVRIY